MHAVQVCRSNLSRVDLFWLLVSQLSGMLGCIVSPTCITIEYHMFGWYHIFGW